jgi:hypothetical protein
MRPAAVLLVALLVAAPAVAADDPLARARQLYNQREFLPAINEAERARLLPARADSADLIIARAYLERFRESGASDDLTNARERLRRLDPTRLAPAERSEFLIGVGETLYFDNSFGAAAALFASIVDRPEQLSPDARERTLDWWATSIDRDARGRSEADREAMAARIHDRMRDEMAARPASSVAAYWLVASARSQGELQEAWDAAQAGWVRAALAADHGEALRTDLDDLMQRAIIPERARALGQPVEALRLEWERFKERWKRG